MSDAQTITVHPIMMDAPGYMDPRWKAARDIRRTRVVSTGHKDGRAT